MIILLLQPIISPSLGTIRSPGAPKNNEVLQTLTLAMDPRLFNAAFTGDVNVLLGLIQEDPLILHTVALTTSNTPLHVAALLGHAEFAMVAMQNHPGLADELNQQGFSPIHLASAKGHWEIVRGMLVRRPDLALIKMKMERILFTLLPLRGDHKYCERSFRLNQRKSLLRRARMPSMSLLNIINTRHWDFNSASVSKPSSERACQCQR